MTARVLATLAVLVLAAPAADAQTWTARGFFDAGASRFTAAQSFETVLGSATGALFGGGGELVMPLNRCVAQRRARACAIVAALRVSRFHKSGERAFVFEGETFGLGIDTDVRITPVEVTGGYRFGGQNQRVIPYAGGGVGWHRYSETSEFAEDEENVNETHTGFHVLGGAEVRVARWAAIAGEVQWTTVPDALGSDPNGVSAAFDEHNLGGTAVRVKFVIGR